MPASSEPAGKLKIPAKPAVEQLRFASEKRMLDEILQDEALKKRIGEFLKKDAREANRRRLLATGLRITESIIPTLAQTVETAQKIAHMEDRQLEVYVCDDPRQNAACIDFGEGRLFLLFSSSMIERLSPRELLFVIGHELGHSCYQHHRLPVNALLGEKRGINAKLALKLSAWNRRAEISADRLGLLCCQELNSATHALIKLSCGGLKEPLLRFNVDAYMAQMRDIETLSESVQDVEDWFSSHPFSPLRVVALHHLWDSELLAGLLGHAPAKINTEEMDAKIDALLKSMEPDGDADPKSAGSNFLVWAGYRVAAADGRIDKAECESIRSMTSEEAARNAEAEIRSAKDPRALIEGKCKKAAKLCLTLPPSDRHALVQSLIAVARADTKLEESEKETLRDLCSLLEVSPAFIEQMLMMME